MLTSFRRHTHSGDDKMWRISLALAMLAPVVGCTQHPQDIVPRPTALTIQAAVAQIQDAVVQAAERARNTGQYSGFYPCTAQAVLNVTADAHDQNTLVLDASIKPALPGAPSLSANDTIGSSANASVGNQITVVLASSYCLPAQSSTNAGTQNPPSLAPRAGSSHASTSASRTSSTARPATVGTVPRASTPEPPPSLAPRVPQ
jgi:hypothetical protein